MEIAEGCRVTICTDGKIEGRQTSKDDERHGSSPASSINAQNEAHGMTSQSCPHTTEQVTRSRVWISTAEWPPLLRRMDCWPHSDFSNATMPTMVRKCGSSSSEISDCLEFLCKLWHMQIPLSPCSGRPRIALLAATEFWAQRSQQGCVFPSLRLTKSGPAGLRLA
jgi:hypothetical protein